MCALLALAGEDDLGGKITTGKAKKLADAGAALMKEADAIFRRWVLDEIPEDELLAELERGIELYDAGAAKLQEALDIQEDGAVLHRLQVGAKRLQKMRFMVHFRLRPQVKAKPRAAPLGMGGAGIAGGWFSRSMNLRSIRSFHCHAQSL